MRRTISGMIGAGSLAHNRRDFVAENVDPDRVHLNICYQNENLKEVYKELFDDSVERYNVGKRKDRQITNYYEKIRQGKQEKLFHEVIFQIGNREDMAVGTTEGDLAVKVLDEYVKNFQQRNPTLHVFSCYLHQDEATPHLHIDFVPYVTGWKGKGMDTRVSLKQALKSLGFQGGNKHDTDKKYAQLKLKQKEKIAEWMFQVTRDYYTKNYTFPNDRQIEKVVNIVYEKIEEAEIWVPYGEVLRHYKSKRSAINRRVRKELNEKEENRNEKVCFMNMCMVQDDKGNVLALDKVNDSYTGTTFPGGHVEQNEIFQKSIIREVWEETGLTIESPKLCGLYHWHEDGVHSVIMLYKAEKFIGELKSSEEGQVYWIPLEELKTRELATGMKYVLQILGADQVNECYMHLESEGYVGDLY